MNRLFGTAAIVLFLAWVHLVDAAAAEHEYRSWSDKSGNFSVEARFVKLDGASVVLQTRDDREIRVSITKLGGDDISYVQSASGSKSEPDIEGIWGGKWDDTWPVYLVIQKEGDDGSYGVKYVWYENLERPLQKMNKTGKWESHYIDAGILIFRRIEDEIILYGKFRRPRAARLVKLDVEEEDLAEVKLEESTDWKEGAPEAEAARALILSK